jgi:hypothetical protein
VGLESAATDTAVSKSTGAGGSALTLRGDPAAAFFAALALALALGGLLSPPAVATAAAAVLQGDIADGRCA